MRSRSLTVLVLATLATACGADSGEPRAQASEPPASSSTSTVSTSTVSTSTVPTSPVPTSTVPSLSAADEVPSATAPPAFAASVHPVDEDELGVSWRPGCPVGAADLRRIDMPHHDGGGGVVTGSLVVHAEHVDDLIGVFERLFAAGFPIARMQPVTAFDGDDDASMAANNTSAFNCREIAGRPGVWSQHSYGGAVDINPLVNPWVRGAAVDPPAGEPFVDRTVEAEGLIRAGDVVTAAFAEIGWGWGGDWSSSKDYQHFSHNGR